ncbi:MAG TPA: circadian clock KaiB family protein [Segetibacter sp.]|jgi:circadian clock protein KaiB
MSNILFSIYIAGPASRNAPAIKAFDEVCTKQLEAGTYEIQIVDIARQPSLAEANKILAIPTIVREKPLPQRRIIGDMRQPEKAIRALEFLLDEIEIKTTYEEK